MRSLRFCIAVERRDCGSPNRLILRSGLKGRVSKDG
jgi:hypothetical protein